MLAVAAALSRMAEPQKLAASMQAPGRGPGLLREERQGKPATLAPRRVAPFKAARPEAKLLKRVA